MRSKNGKKGGLPAHDWNSEKGAIGCQIFDESGESFDCQQGGVEIEMVEKRRDSPPNQFEVRFGQRIMT